jgi:hypothetical protein
LREENSVAARTMAAQETFPSATFSTPTPVHNRDAPTNL